MSNDPIRDYNADRERRLGQAVPQANDAANNSGRFGLVERRQREETARMEAHRREQAVALLRRTLMREPTTSEVAEALNR